MILSLSQFLLGLVLLCFLWIILDWCWNSWRDYLSRLRVKRSFRQCHLCGKTYAESARVKLSDCPDCSAVNTKRGPRRLA